MVSLHNGGGVGIGKAINGGFGIVLDGSERVDRIIETAIPWDVMGGVARRAWARNAPAIETGIAYNKERGGTDHITLPYLTDGGKLLMELGCQQAKEAKALLEGSGYLSEVRTVRDLQGHERLVIGENSN